MLKKWIQWINSGIGSVCALFVAGTLFLSFTKPEITTPDTQSTNRALPACSFARPQSACDAIGNTLELKYSPPTIQLPDLRAQLIYNGKNGRPDAQPEKTVLHFSFANSSNPPTPILVGEPLYIIYEKKPPGQSPYSFSPSNAETPMWITASPWGNEAIVKLFLKNEKGELITEPASNIQFNLPEKEVPRTGKTWELGKWRVDGSLLARQKARWMGPDLFLTRHGGEEYKASSGKHRIDFTDEENVYAVYVGLNDSLIWDNGRWKNIEPGADSRDFPLMIVKKIDERLINFELWDVAGKNKLFLNLVKTNEPWAPQNIQSNFKFVGARTRSQYIFEINGERMFLRPKDWVLQTADGWIKLETPKQIDDYVERRLIGVLFVFEGVDTKENQQVLQGTMFNAGRTEVQEISLPILAKNVKKSDAAMPQNSEDEDDEDDDDEDDDDEEIVNTYPAKSSGE